MPATEIVWTFRESAARALRSDFGRDKATDAQRAALVTALRPIPAPVAQDYASWRAAVLYLAAVALVLGALLHLVGFQTVKDQIVQGLILAEEQRGAFTDEFTATQQVEFGFGVDNLAILDMIPIISLLALVLVALLTVMAARSWLDVGRSAKLARLGWFVLVGTPLLLAIFPWSRTLDFGHLDPQNADAMRSMLGITLGVYLFLNLAPKLIAVFPGIIRASVTLKSLLHESPVPGYTVVLLAPVYAMFVVVVFTTVNQMEGSLVLLAALACLVVAPLIYLFRAREFLKPHTAEESATLVRSVRRQSYLFNLTGAGLLVLFLADIERVTMFQILEFFIMAGGGVLLMMVVASDLVLGLLRLQHDQAKLFIGSELADQFEVKMSTLADAGFGAVGGKRRGDESAA